MREIKFRGETWTGKLVYGEYRHQHDKTIILEGAYPWRVKPESVSQLVGHDKRGAEVCEGDTLVDELEQEYVAWLTPTPERMYESFELKRPEQE